MLVSGGSIYYGTKAISQVYQGEDLIWPLYPREYLTFDILSGGTLQFSGNCESVLTVQYKVNNGAWNTMQVYSATSADAITVNEGDTVYWKSLNYTSTSIYPRKSSSFMGTSVFNARGNILSLVYGDNAYGKTTPIMCYGLFSGSNIVSAENLVLPPTVAERCYDSMFYGCTSLTSAPALPATTLALLCYDRMFQNCTNLTQAPALPATTLAESCYNSMFWGCTNLTQAPALPATTLAEDCYRYMFESCSSLTTAPELLAPVLVAYCYYGMFSRCASLNYIKCLATDLSAEYCLAMWLRLPYSVTGTFVKKAGVEWPSGTSGIPNTWTVIEE